MLLIIKKENRAMRKIIILIKSLAILSLAGFVFVACNSSGTGDSPDTDTSDIFISSDETFRFLFMVFYFWYPKLFY